MQWIDHAGIRAKVALAPAILAVLMVAIIIHGLTVLAANRASTERERTVSGHSERIAALSSSILTARGNLYRLVSLASKEKDPAKIAQMSKDAMAELGTVLASLPALEQSGAELGVDPAEVADSVDKLKKFLTGARDVADMVTDDIGYALIMTGALDRKYEAAAQSFDKVEDTIASIRAKSAEDLISSMALARTTFIGGGVIAVVLAVVLTLFLSIRIAAPVKSLTDVVQRLSRREYEIPVPHQELRDETGDMARAVETLRKVGLEAVRLEAVHEQEQRLKEARAAKVDERLRRFDAEVRDALAAMMGSSDSMRDITGTMAVTAGETHQRAGLVANVTTRTSENVNIMAGAAEELMASIGEISRQVEHSTSIVAEAVGHVAEATTVANGLSDEARKINDVVELINTIARQTNMLALNATIEAARAGESGKGFAVVANEVKNLANQTSGATEQIAQEIAAVQKAAATVVETIEGVAHTIERMSAIATAVAAAIQEQGAATGEISRSIKEVSDGTREVGSAVSEMSDAARGSESAGHQVRDAAVHLSDRASSLQTSVSAFLAEVAAI